MLFVHLQRMGEKSCKLFENLVITKSGFFFLKTGYKKSTFENIFKKWTLWISVAFKNPVEIKNLTPLFT